MPEYLVNHKTVKTSQTKGKATIVTLSFVPNKSDLDDILLDLAKINSLSIKINEFE